MSKINFAFFGGEPLSVPVLEKLYEKGHIPSLIVSNPDKPQGRYMEISSPPTALWAKSHNIPLIQPEDKAQLLQFFFDDKSVIARGEEKKLEAMELFVVVSYGKIIPKEVLDLPKLGTINLHPSLLPKYRGPAPIVAAILNGDNETGASIMKIDEELDHGPILAQEKITLSGNEMVQDLEKSLAELGGELLVRVIPDFVAGKIIPKEQDHEKATFTKKIVKEDGEINLEDDPIQNWRKFRAYAAWPRTYFFHDGKRIIITSAALENGKFVIKKIIPEGGKEMDYKS